MPPPLALTLTAVFVSILFWRDSRKSVRVSAALWLPVIWIFFVGSKFLSQWLNLFGLPIGDSSQEDGSPIDAVFFLALILMGLFVLGRRRVAVLEFVRNNGWLTIFLVYGFLAIIWSDFPLVASKRWIKVLGHPIMALVVLTDPEPKEAVRRVLSRSGYMLLPLSVLFIKYYPQFGRYFDAWTGAATNAGIMHNKNELGYVCMVFGLFFAWNLLSLFRTERKAERWSEMAVTLTFIWMTWWLFSVANSATSLACVVVGATTMVIVGLPLVSRRFIGSYIVAALLIVVAAQMSFGTYDKVVELLGRNVTLTDRTAVWQDVIAIDKSPVFGAGFESFWLGPRLEALWTKWWWHPIQAHNGYIETYLNLGWIGVVILFAVIIATFRKARRALIQDFDFGRFRLGVLFAIILYNYTEATFTGVHLVWTVFYLIAIDYPMVKPAASAVQPLGSAVGSGNQLAERSRDNPGVDLGFRPAGWRRPAAVSEPTPSPLNRRWQ